MLTRTREKRSLSLFFRAEFWSTGQNTKWRPRKTEFSIFSKGVREVVLIGRAMVHRVALEVFIPISSLAGKDVVKTNHYIKQV